MGLCVTCVGCVSVCSCMCVRARVPWLNALVNFAGERGGRKQANVLSFFLITFRRAFIKPGIHLVDPSLPPSEPLLLSNPTTDCGSSLCL